MSNKKELLYHLKKVQSLTSSIPYKNRKTKKKIQKNASKKKIKNSNVDDDLSDPNIFFSRNVSNKDGDLDFYFSLFHREQEFKKHFNKIKMQIYFIRWCHSFELKVLNRKHPKYYYNPKILSYVDHFPSTYQEPSIHLKDPTKISQLTLPVSSSEKIVDAVKRVSRAHRKSIHEKEIQSQREKKMPQQKSTLDEQEMNDFYQDADSNADENDNYDEELLKFTKQLLSKRANSLKKRVDNGSRTNSQISQNQKYSKQRNFVSKINADDASTSTLSSAESTISKNKGSKQQIPKEQSKNPLKVSPAFELHTKRAKKPTQSKLTLVQDSTISTNNSTTSKLEIDKINSIDSSSHNNSKDELQNNKKDNFFDFDPFTFGIPKSTNKNSNIQNNMSSESSQNQKYKLMKIEQSVISIRPDHLKLVSISDQDQSLPPTISKKDNRSYQFLNNEYNISVPPSQSNTQIQSQQQASDSLSTSSSSKSKSQDQNNNDILSQEDSSSQTEINTAIDQSSQYSNQDTPDTKIDQPLKSPTIQNNQPNDSLELDSQPILQTKTQTKTNEDDETSELDFDLSDLKLPKSIKPTKNEKTQKTKLKSTDDKEMNIQNQIQSSQYNASLSENSSEQNKFLDSDLNINTKTSKKSTKNKTETNLDNSSNESNDSNSNKSANRQTSSSISTRNEDKVSNIPNSITDEVIVEEEEEETEYENGIEERFEIKKQTIIINSSKQRDEETKEEINSFSNEIDEVIQKNPQLLNPSKVHFSFDQQEDISTKGKVKKTESHRSKPKKEDEAEDEIKLEIDLREKKKKNKKKDDDFNLKDILPLSILDEIMNNNSSNSENEDAEERKLNNSNNLFTSDEEKIIQSYMSNSDDDYDNDKMYKDQGSQFDDSIILEHNNLINENNSEQSTPPNTKNNNNQKSSPLSLSSGYDDDSSSSESFIDKLKKIFPNLDLD